MRDSRPDVVIFGAGGHARVVRDALVARGQRVIARLDEHEEDRYVHLPHVAVVAIGDNEQRSRVVARIAEKWPDTVWAKVIHPAAVISADAHIAPGAMVLALAVVGPEARVGNHAILNTAAVLEHDATLGDYAHAAPGAICAGGVRIGDRALVGMGARILPSLRVGPGAWVGAGAVVTEDVPAQVVAAGVPCRTIRPR